MTLTVAAERLGWRLHRMRSLARRQDWPKRRPNAGAYLIPAGLLAELREQVADLAAQLGRAEGELAAELRRSADLVATITALRAELAEARKGWLVRLIEAVRRR